MPSAMMDMDPIKMFNIFGRLLGNTPQGYNTMASKTLWVKHSPRATKIQELGQEQFQKQAMT